MQGALIEPGDRLVASIAPVLSGFGPEVGISAFAASSLRFLGRVNVPQLPVPAPTSSKAAGLTQEVDVSGLSATLFGLQGVRWQYKYNEQAPECGESQLFALDLATGRLRQTVNITEALGAGACGADLVRLTEPSPPRAGSAAVLGNRVALRWAAPFGATQYAVEAGSAPGRTDLALLRTADPQLVVEGVPTGVYFVRVRALNTIGASAPSGELRVVVP